MGRSCWTAGLSRALRLLCAGLSCLLLSSCLLATGMLPPEEADYPLAAGTTLAVLSLPDRTPKQDADGKPKTASVAIVDGFYVVTETGDDFEQVFRLARIADTAQYIVLMKPDSLGVPGVVVGLLSATDGDYVPSYLRAEDFERYLAWLREHDAGRLRDYEGAFERRTLDSVDAVAFGSLDLLKSLVAEMDARGFTTQEIAYRAIAPAATADAAAPGSPPVDIALERAFVDTEIARLDEEIRGLCGGRVCHYLADGRVIYRTDTYDPPMWYFDDGRLAPRELWRE